MKSFTGVQGSQTTVPELEINVDTVYVRTNIAATTTDDFTGWTYDEIQYGKNEYLSLISGKTVSQQEQIVQLGLTILESEGLL